MRKVVAIPETKRIIAQGGALISDLDQSGAEQGLATGRVIKAYLTVSERDS